LTLTLPTTWQSHSLNLDEFSFYPPSHPAERLFFWEDMHAVKSSGPGHGTTILRNVGTTPKAIASWFTSNPDFQIISPPTQVTSIDGFTATRIVVGVSPHARYGDSDARRILAVRICSADATTANTSASAGLSKSALTWCRSRSTGVGTPSSSP
jgi:hypothetical protein